MAVSLMTCRACRGFVPTRSTECPHCGASFGTSPLMRGLFVLVGTGIAAATLMACYGAPPCDYKADAGTGNQNCYNIDDNPDAGQPDAGQ